ncbi:unnamed protein product, partial [Mesorhabditis spiculigera]
MFEFGDESIFRKISRTNFSDAFSESFRTLALTARRNSSPLTRKSTKKMKKSRLISKNGVCNVYNANVPKKDRQYLRDIFTTMIDVKWRYMFVIFALVFISSWSFFATLYYMIAWFHGDLPEQLMEAGMNVNHTQCIANLEGFYASFLFAVETHHTIGYGHRYTTTECKTAGLVVCTQCICGLLIQSFMLCFLCRVGDMRNTHLVEAHVRLQFITDRETSEGEIEPLHQYEMKVGPSITDDDRIFLVWPTTLCHVIDKESPLYEYAAHALPSAQFEIIVLLEGIVESTGMTAQARTSYLPTEILWGHRFRKLVTYQRSNGSYQIDYNLFNCTYPVKTPSSSAAEYYKSSRNSSEYFCHDHHEHRLDEVRSMESTPTPSILTSYPNSPLPNGIKPQNPDASNSSIPPPSIVVECPSNCASPNHADQKKKYTNCRPNNNIFNFYTRDTSCALSSGDLSGCTRPSTALSDLEEERDPLSPPPALGNKRLLQEELRCIDDEDAII